MVAPHAFTTTKLGRVASSRSVGATITFKMDSDATHNMHGNVELCHNPLANFDSSRRIRIGIANGVIICAEGCGRLIEGGLLSEEVWRVPDIGNKGLSSIWLARLN